MLQDVSPGDDPAHRSPVALDLPRLTAGSSPETARILTALGRRIQSATCGTLSVVIRSRDPSERVFELTGCFGVRLDEGRKAELQAFYEECCDYHELVTGQKPGPNEAQELLTALPPGKAHDDKFVIGLFDAPGHMIGVLDAIRDYPRPGEWYLGLLLLAQSLRRHGLGERVYRRLEEWVAASGGTAIHLIVTEQSPGALRFWQRMGFEVKGMGKQKLKARENVFLKMTRSLAPAPEPTGTFIKSWLAAWRRGPGGGG
jgi:ribosomal protein S18 acetylase RimI-like enzyme